MSQHSKLNALEFEGGSMFAMHMPGQAWSGLGTLISRSTEAFLASCSSLDHCSYLYRHINLMLETLYVIYDIWIDVRRLMPGGILPRIRGMLSGVSNLDLQTFETNLQHTGMYSFTECSLKLQVAPEEMSATVHEPYARSDQLPVLCLMQASRTHSRVTRMLLAVPALLLSTRGRPVWPPVRLANCSEATAAWLARQRTSVKTCCTGGDREDVVCSSLRFCKRNC